MRGEEEQKCLNVVKKIVFYNTEGNILHDCNNKTFLDVDDNTFCEHLWQYFRFNKNAFGLSKSDMIEVADLLKKAKPNANKSDFPDFVAENGFIEHFQVTSSKENRKGSLQKIEENNFLREFGQKEEVFKKQCNESQEDCTGKYVEQKMTDPEHGYKFFQESFKRNFQNHLESLDKYKGNKQVGIFMIENDDLSAEMFENIYENFPKETTWGDLREAQTFQCYRLSRDKNLLRYIYNYKDKLKYVIHVYYDSVQDKAAKGIDAFNCTAVPKIEVIKIESIPNILRLLPWNFYIDISGMTRISRTYCVSVKR